VLDEVHDWIGPTATGGPPSEFRLTDDERALRDLAYPLIDPANDHARHQDLLFHYGVSRVQARVAPVRRTDYWDRLKGEYRRSEASAYARIIADSRNDVERVGPFFAMASRVLDVDDKRARSLPQLSTLSRAEARNAALRSRENLAVVAWVCHALKERTASYRYALERLVVSVPSPLVVEVERALALHQQRTGQYCSTAVAKA
jgi:hypothetical protein